MSRKKQHLRIAALFCLFSFLQSLILPSVALALTSGPTAPETTNFEPVDATDMVSMLTGDFSYTLPLIEVPGPEGGYPLSLAYHAGIKPLSEASWTGLGWNISPGAINRMVNGYPDDQYNVNQSVHDRWEGGITETFSVGITVGVSDNAKVGLGLGITTDTYQGISGDLSLTLNFGQKGSKFGVGGGVSIGTRGARANVSASIGSLSASASTDSKGNSGVGLSYSTYAQTSVGISMTSGGLNPSLKVGGQAAKIGNNNYGKISSESGALNFGISIGGVFSIGIGYSYRRYWMDERDNVKVFGTLHAKDASNNFATQSNDYSFDSYDLLQKDLNLGVHNDPTWLIGGSYPDYDSYQVTGQGIGGSIQPYIFENGTMFSKWREGTGSTDWATSYRKATSFTKKVNFRFKNDFSNAIDKNGGQFNFYSNGNPYITGQSTTVNSTGYNSSDQHLAGSKHVEWFKNSELTQVGSNPSTAAQNSGFVDYRGSVNRSTFNSKDISKQIGGYSITNESGVTYHYALPAYTYGEFSSSFIPSSSQGDSWNKQTRDHPYAYSWLLTAITGPDYVDRNNDGHVDEDDWGYWVEFDYGKWLSNYRWRTPVEGANLDIKHEVHHTSFGIKELYYLDAVKTRTHTALFVKDIRKDGKGVRGPSGGFGKETAPHDEVECHYEDYIVSFSKSQMKLDKIVLFKNKDLYPIISSLGTLKASTNNYNYSFTYYPSPSSSPPTCFDQFTAPAGHNGGSVIDVNDYQNYSAALLPKMLKSIELETDYSLQKETKNSLDHTNLYKENPVLVRDGKLTLKKITYKGRNNVTTLPPLEFTYDYESPTNYTYNVTSSSNVYISGGNSSWEGDIVTYTKFGKDYYLVLVDYTSGGNFTYQNLSEVNTPSSSHSGSGSSGISKTKNPPFNSKKVDYWGNFKSDFTNAQQLSVTDVRRSPTLVSSASVDAWSLREIETSIGAKIKMNYEAKEYHNTTMQKQERFNISTMTKVYPSNIENYEFKLYFLQGENLTNIFSVGNTIKVTSRNNTSCENGNNCGVSYTTYGADILAVYSNYIKVDINAPNVASQGCCFPDYIESVSLTLPGYIDFDKDLCFGDGVRIASIDIENSTGDESKVAYDYHNSGVIAYNPSTANFPPSGSTTGYIDKYTRDVRDVIVHARELPPPTVMYEKVTVADSYNGNELPGKRRYYFQTFEEDMVNVDRTYESSSNNVHRAKVEITDKTSLVGSLIKMEELDAFDGTEQIVSTVENDYASNTSADWNAVSKQGVVVQAFNEARYKNDNAYRKAVISERHEYVTYLKSTTTTTNGQSTTTSNRAFDFYSGVPTEVETEDTYGQHFLARSIPAYEKYSGMGFKIYNINHKNMLVQTTAKYLNKSDGNGTIQGNPISANITTWEDDWKYRYRNTSTNSYVDPTNFDSDKIWRKNKSYAYKSETKPDGTFDTWNDFSWSFSATNADWLKVNEVTRYDHYSKPLEEKGADGNYAGAKMGYSESLPLVTAAPAKYVEFAFSSGEDHLGSSNYFGGEVKAPTSTAVVTTEAHTGDYSVRLNSGTRYGFNYSIPCRIYNQSAKPGEIERKKYEARVWIHESNVSTGFNYMYCNYKDGSGNSLQWDGVTIGDPTTIKAGEWYQLRLPIEINNGNLLFCTRIEVGTWVGSSSGNIYFDDFRFAPVDAAITSYVYDQQTDQVTHILDQENLFTEYVYDEAGRLTKVYRETTENPTGKRLVSENEYHYKRSF